MLRKIVATLAVVGVLGSLSAFGVLSVFTDTASVPTNAFTIMGTIEISTSPTSTLVHFSDMMPGDKVTAPITVSNDGNLQLRYAVTSVADNDDTKGLRDKLVLRIRELVTTCDNDHFLSTGSPLYTGVLGASPTAKNIIGDPTQGSQTGDRTLDASPSPHSEVLCFQVELPLDTGNEFRGAQTAAEFTFWAEQTINNP